MGFRVTDDEYELIVARARAVEMPVSFWIRRQLLRPAAAVESRAA